MQIQTDPAAGVPTITTFGTDGSDLQDFGNHSSTLATILIKPSLYEFTLSVIIAAEDGRQPVHGVASMRSGSVHLDFERIECCEAGPDFGRVGGSLVGPTAGSDCGGGGGVKRGFGL